MKNTEILLTPILDGRSVDKGKIKGFLKLSRRKQNALLNELYKLAQIS